MWESGKEYYVTGDIVVEQGATLKIQPEVWVLFKADTEADYYGLTVKGTLIADGGIRRQRADSSCCSIRCSLLTVGS